jgi:hypothetical protein
MPVLPWRKEGCAIAAEAHPQGAAPEHENPETELLMTDIDELVKRLDELAAVITPGAIVPKSATMRGALLDAARALESLQRELEEARKHLAYAIEEADRWCDESRGCDVRGPEMDAARAFLAARQQQGG